MRNIYLYANSSTNLGTYKNRSIRLTQKRIIPVRIAIRDVNTLFIDRALNV